MSFPISPRARDITFNFNDSCNCCRGRQPSDEKRVYINHLGQVESYDERKGRLDRQRAKAKAISNLNINIEQRIKAVGGDIEFFRRRIFDVLYEIEDKGIITLAQIQTINEIMLVYIKELGVEPIVEKSIIKDKCTIM